MGTPHDHDRPRPRIGKAPAAGTAFIVVRKDRHSDDGLTVHGTRASADRAVEEFKAGYDDPEMSWVEGATDRRRVYYASTYDDGPKVYIEQVQVEGLEDLAAELGAVKENAEAQSSTLGDQVVELQERIAQLEEKLDTHRALVVRLRGRVKDDAFTVAAIDAVLGDAEMVQADADDLAETLVASDTIDGAAVFLLHKDGDIEVGCSTNEAAKPLADLLGLFAAFSEKLARDVR